MAQKNVSEAPVAGKALEPVAALDFHGHSIPLYHHEGQTIMAGPDLGRALGYEYPRKAISTIWNRYTEELTPHATVLNLRTVRGKSRETRAFNETGAYLVAMFSETPRAKEMRLWLAELPKRVREMLGAPPSTITPDQQQHIRNLVAARAKALPHGAGFPQIWERVKNHFGVARYQDIPAAQFEAVVEYLLKMELKQEQKALPQDSPSLSSFDMLIASDESAAFDRDREQFSRNLYDAYNKAVYRLQAIKPCGRNASAMKEIIRQEIYALRAQYDATGCAAHVFSQTLFRVDRFVKIANVL